MLFLIPLVLYLPSYGAGFLWDDNLCVTENPMVMGGMDGLRDIWFSKRLLAWFPLTFSSFWLEWRLWGANPLGYHFTNVLLHSLSTLLLWRLLCKLRLPGAWFAALLFAVHPVCVASVAWITERKNTLSMPFFLLSLLLYLHSEEGPPHPRRPGFPPETKSYVLSLLAFIAALLSKTSVVALPLMLLLLAWWRRGRITRKDCWRSLPFFAAAFTMGLVTLWFENNSATPETAPDTLAVRLLAGSRALWLYVGNTVLPLKLAMIYPRWQIAAGSLLSWGPALLSAAALLLFWRYRRSWSRAWLFAIGYLVLALAPVLGVFNVNFFSYSQRSDHLQYLAVPGVLAFLAAGACWLRLELPRKSAPHWLGSRWLTGSLAGAFAGLLALSAWHRQEAFANPEALWRDNLPKNPNSWKVRNNLGVALMNQGRFNEAIGHFEQALSLRPNYTGAHNNLGGALRGLGRYHDAEAHYQTALKLNPNEADAHNNLGLLLLDLDRFEEAMPHLRAAVQLNPHDATAHYNLGNLLGRQGKSAEALTSYRAALKLAPSDPEIHNNLACLLLLERNFGEATEHFRAAIRLKPNNPEACNNLGSALLEQAQPAEAVAPLTKAVQLSPAYAEAHYNLGNADAALNHPREAMAEYQIALRLKPNYAEARYRLGNLFATGGNSEAAVEQYRAALAANPKQAEAHHQMATLLVARKEVAEGITHYREAVRLKPDWLEALNNLAWLLATCKDAHFRQGAEALRLARHAAELTQHKDGGALDTLAAACAEAGLFVDAVGAEQEALRLSAGDKDQLLADQMQARLQLYQGQQPYRE